LRIGLANRVVSKGGARREAESLAAEIARAPQTCMREDRASAIEQAGMPLQAAMENELRHGLTSLSTPELADGVATFVAGAGRGGKWVGSRRRSRPHLLEERRQPPPLRLVEHLAQPRLDLHRVPERPPPGIARVAMQPLDLQRQRRRLARQQTRRAIDRAP